MVRKIFALIIITAVSSFYAMEQSISKVELPECVKTADYVKIESTRTIAYYPLDDETTVLDLKNFIFQNDRVPVDRQKLFTYDSYGFTQLVVDKTGNNVKNEEKIKELMSIYKTDSFYIYQEPENNS